MSTAHKTVREGRGKCGAGLENVAGTASKQASLVLLNVPSSALPQALLIFALSLQVCLAAVSARQRGCSPLVAIDSGGHCTLSACGLLGCVVCCLQSGPACCLIRVAAFLSIYMYVPAHYSAGRTARWRP